MASIQKRGNGWFVQVRRKGVTRCATFPTKSKAKAWAVEAEAEILAGNVGAVERTTLGDVLGRYADEVSPGKRGARWEIVRLRSWEKHPLAAFRIGDVGPPQLALWRDERLKSVSGATVAREMNLLSSVFEIARKEWGLIVVNPLKDVAKPPRPRSRNRIYEDDEIRRVLVALGYDEGRPVETKQQIISVLFLVALETAMRLGEMIGLEWYQVDTRRRVVALELTKNGDAREVPLSPRAAELFGKVRGFATPFEVSRDVASVLFARALKAAEVDEATFHDSRATAITNKLSKTFDIHQLARITGHRDLNSLLVYYRESAEDMAKRLK